MSIRTLARAFTGGEVTPEFFGRVDDAKNLTGLQLARNFNILPHGPAANRAGTRFVKATKYANKLTRLIRFNYSEDQNLIIEIGEGYMRFHTFGATLLAGTVTAWSNATVYTIGDLASRLGVNYYCILGHTNQQPPNATYWYAMPSDGTFEIPTPYQEADIFDLHFVQSEDVVTITHPSYAPRELRRLGAVRWDLIPIAFASDLPAPGSIAATNTVGTGTTTYSYTVTAVDATGQEEGLQGTPASTTNNLLTTGNYNTITFAAVTGAVRYNVYKQDNGLYGFIGQTDALTFRDENIAADLSKTPPIARDPFNGSNKYPAAVSYYEQRRVFGGTNNLPQNLWLTRLGTDSNLSYSIPSRESDGIAFRIAALQANRIRHLVPLADLLVLTSSAVWMVTSVNSDSITPTSITVKPQSYVGASNVQPVVANVSMLYEAARGGHVRELRYSLEGGGYQSKDLSLRAPHLFNFRRILDFAYVEAPYSIVYGTSSFGILLGLTYVPEEDLYAWFWYDTYTNAGSTTLTKSEFKSCAAASEGNEDYLYAIVKRYINGAFVQYIERQASRNFEDQHDCYFVDCGATLDSPVTITGITKANPGVVTTSTAHGISNGDAVDILAVAGMTEVNGQRYYAAGVTATTLQLVDEYGANIDTSGFGTYFSGGELRKVVTTISSGLSHLEGETVSILANGAVQPQRTVVGGALNAPLEVPASIVHIGLPLRADMQTLPLAFEAQAFGQGRAKNVNKAILRIYRSLGAQVGPNFDALLEVKARSDEPYGVATALQTGEVDILIEPSWGDEGSVCVRQDEPLPLTVLSMVLETEVGS